MQIFLASSAIKASCERLEGMMEAFDVTPTGMTLIPHAQDVYVSSLKPLGASRPRGAALNWMHPSHS